MYAQTKTKITKIEVKIIVISSPPFYISIIILSCFRFHCPKIRSLYQTSGPSHPALSKWTQSFS